MMTAKEDKTQVAEQEPALSEDQRRPILGSVSSHVSTSTSLVASAPRYAVGAQESSSIRSSSSSAGDVKRNHGKLMVFQDDANTQPPTRVLPTASSANVWAEYGIETQIRKENTVQATSWKGATVPQQKSGKAPVERISVYRDEVYI
jgi:hypothetical protein